ncbi:nucleoside 2-deoxyribosyltransferase [Novosphingobium sp. YJ-S2-02]|uniref:Nucleoside 2-deoxyribosyltransferase n=1 Tax=Novosphingobium aureum TaxID=2792964 RepID=A0A931HBZ6_9SPHN|nr:nucleoside 2-deoxyribosyltransferase [Novosphingobium aureum]MBH0113235.1 nucleoside 2-deoxyribosyltransferase [Novosphingobium aureum]
MKRYTVYLAGPISGLGYAAATDWRASAIDWLEQHGIQGLSPLRAKDYLSHITADVGFSETCEDYAQLSALSTQRGVMDRDRFDATRCDVLLVNLLGATKVSVGTVMEIAWADQKRTPIIALIEADRSNVHEHAMVNEAIGFRAPSLEEGLHLVRSILA